MSVANHISRRWLAILVSGSMVLGSGAAFTGTAFADTPETTVMKDIAVSREQQTKDSSQPADMEFQSETDESSASAAADTAVSSLGVTLGSGITTYVNAQLDQKDVYAKALKAVVKWRRDALTDTRVKFLDDSSERYVTVAEYLKINKIPTSTYLSPKWSNALERIAVQRAIEAYDYDLAHTRPNGESCFTARYGNDGSFGEILAWTFGDIESAIDLWASEKADYINEVNGKEHGVTGHYTSLISPYYTRYGFGAESGTFAGEMSNDGMEDLSETPTNWTGAKQVEVNLSADKMALGADSNVPPTMIVGQRLQATVQLHYQPERYTFKGTWASSAPDVIAVTSGGSLTVLKTGSTELTVSTNGGHLSKKVTVHAFADTDENTSHLADIDWLSDSGISTGWPREDGTRNFGGMTPVKRQDMAAFLYRLAGSPSFDETTVRNPFKDVSTKTSHYKEIMWLVSTGITEGWTEKDGSKVYRGMSNVKRQDMAAFLHRLANHQKANPTLGKPIDFADVDERTPHVADIEWLSRTGVTEGWTEKDGSTVYRGMNDIVRQDMAAFLHRMDAKVLK